jgi:signal transduction histidine kinase
MTVKRRIFLTNSMMVLLSLTVLLLIVGGMVSLFKEEFLGWYRDNSKISDQYAQVYMEMPALIENTDTFEQLAENLGEYDYRLIVVNQKGKTVYQNARHSEEESAETLYTQEKTPGELVGYFVENTSILSYRDTRQDQYYDFYAVSCPSGVSIMGMDRGMFEMFLLVLLAVGVAAIAVILLLSQILTKWLTAQILKPVKELDLAARRVIDGDLSTQICYNTEDEFKNTCDSFDLMQQHLKQEMEKNHAYELARTEMVSGISHDLRTPLTSVKGYIKGMLDGIANTEEKQREYLKIAYRKACDMDKLLSKLFYFSKLETGNMPFYMKKTDMAEYVTDYVEDKALEIHDGDMAISADVNGLQEVYCNIDREQMVRVLDNLVENARKYAGKCAGRSAAQYTDKSAENNAGETMLNGDSLQMRLSLQKQDGKLVLDFSDNGVGVPEDKLDKIFEQFYREDESRSSEGNGLGLYVCKYIVEQHGGTIRAYNQNGLHIEILLPEVEGGGSDGKNIVGGR